MSEKRAYSYVVLRYRHDPFAGEFANVGVVLYAPYFGFLQAKVRRTIGRLSGIFPDIASIEFKRVVRNIENAIARLASDENNNLLSSLQDAGTISRRVLPDDDSSFFWSPVGSGVSDDPLKTLEKLYLRFVGRYDESHRSGRDDAAVWKPVRDILLDLNLASRLETKVISSAVSSIEFEHAWKNGAWHCYQPVSFDLSSEEHIREKACRWAGTMVSLQDATERFKPHFLVGKPSNPKFLTAYSQALKILERSPVHSQVIEEENAADLAHKIEDEIREHDAKRAVHSSD